MQHEPWAFQYLVKKQKRKVLFHIVNSLNGFIRKQLEVFDERLLKLENIKSQPNKTHVP